MSGQYRPGDLLVGEIEASRGLAVSRTAYREAVRILSAKGLVESKRHVGTTINPQNRWHLLDPSILAWAFEDDPDLTLVEGLFELREIVESPSAAIAAARRTSAHLDAMQDAIERMSRFTLATKAGRRADQDFHCALLAATGNPYIMSFASGVSTAVDMTTIFKQRERPLTRDPVPDHVRVFQAIESRDAPRAQQEMLLLVQLAFQDTPIRRESQGGANRPIRAEVPGAVLR